MIDHVQMHQIGLALLDEFLHLAPGFGGIQHPAKSFRGFCDFVQRDGADRE